MINRTMLDQVEEAIDCFEENWSPDSRTRIHALLEAYDLTDDDAALTELIRIDIELRYKHGIDIQLDDYFVEFDQLKEMPGCVSQIAFEDFRSRSVGGHTLATKRWEHLPGIKNETWFQQLASNRSASPALRRTDKLAVDTDPAFVAALEAAGFQLVHEIGQGALSRVYLATQNELADRYVVLKVVNQALAEPQSMAMLQHTNIVPIYSFHRILTRSVICMPYAGSVTLGHFLKDNSNGDARTGESLVSTVRNRVSDTTILPADPESDPDTKPAALMPAADESAVLKPLEQLRSFGCNELAMRIFQRLAAALAHSHARGVLHGDLKPANVLIRNDGEPALLDFNLSQSLHNQSAKCVGGTLPYMSPESYRALMLQEVTANIASDIYGLGVMLFEFVNGRLPYGVPKAPAPIDLQLAIEERKNEPGWYVDDTVSPGLRSIINHCLAFEPENRYATAEQLQQDLECERGNLPLLHAVEPRRSRIKKWARRHPRLISSGSVGLMLLVLLIPVGLAAVRWRNQSLHMTAIRNFDSFAKESADALSTIMADPQRHEEPGVLTAMKPLERFGVLDGVGLKQFESPQMPSEQRTLQRDTLLRHVAHVAFAEIDRLRPASKQSPLADDQLQRLDRLITAADTIRGDYESRACLFLAANRARLAGDHARFRTLLEQASAIEPSSDSEIYLDAVRLMASRRWTMAMELLTQLADRNSIPSTLRWTMLGRSQYNAGEPEDAKLSITQSIEHAPQASRLWYMRGLCYFDLHQYPRAESDFTRTLELEPTFTRAWFNRGRSRMAQGRFEDAISDFTRGLEHSPFEADLLLSRSRAYRKLGMSEQADQDFDAALETDNLTASSLHSRGLARMDTDPEKAVEDLRQAHLLDPDQVSILTRMARTLSTRLDRPAEAIEILDRAIRIDPNYETAIIDRAVLRAQLGRYDAATQDLKRALRPPNFHRTLYQAACVRALLPDEEDHERALMYLSQAIRAGYDPDDLAADPDLLPIRETDGFRAILEAYELANPPQSQRPPVGDDAHR